MGQIDRQNPQDFPSLSRPKSPHGVRSMRREHALDESFRPSAEQLQKARKWLVHALARRAVEILKEKGQGT